MTANRRASGGRPISRNTQQPSRVFFTKNSVCPYLKAGGFLGMTTDDEGDRLRHAIDGNRYGYHRTRDLTAGGLASCVFANGSVGSNF